MNLLYGNCAKLALFIAEKHVPHFHSQHHKRLPTARRGRSGKAPRSYAEASPACVSIFGRAAVLHVLGHCLVLIHVLIGVSVTCLDGIVQRTASFRSVLSSSRSGDKPLFRDFLFLTRS